MLSNESMEDEILSRCPATTNVVERKNKYCKTDSPNNLKMAMIKVYKFTKLHAWNIWRQKMAYHFYIDPKQKNPDKWKLYKRKKQRNSISIPDASAEYGPPDRSCNFQRTVKTGQKRKATTGSLNNATTKKSLPQIPTQKFWETMCVWSLKVQKENPSGMKV